MRPAISGRATADALAAASRPLARGAHRFHSGLGAHILVADGSRIYDLDDATDEALTQALAIGSLDAALARFGLSGPVPAVDDAPVRKPPLRALSLAIAQKCNLGCVYCYAREGEFGGKPQHMSAETARASIDLLLGAAEPGARYNLSFLGGEPLANRTVLRDATVYARDLAMRRGADVTFSITSNGTLLDEDDAAFFETHGFAVTISLDGLREAHDRLRPFKNGRGSFDIVMWRVGPLLRLQQRMQVSARVTVTPRNLDLRGALDEFVERGFHSVGFSPMLSAPSGANEMAGADLMEMLAAMVACGEEFERRTVAGRRYPFANMLIALREIDKGTHRPYPCGAGAGYFGVSAEGDLAACHRFVGDPAGLMGAVRDGVDSARQSQWLEARHVHRQQPCRDCWARYLCGGGCHHEVIHRGRPACDYIRGWLHYCLGAYARLSSARPDVFDFGDPPVTA